MDNLYIRTLINRIETRFGHSLTSTKDFCALSDDIYKVTGDMLSVSTLKRLFGRFGTRLAPRQSTLSIAARYLGYNDWEEFTLSMSESGLVESDFRPINAIKLDTLPTGSELSISWLPNREIKVRYLGDHKFRIIEAHNTKLNRDDIIEIALLAQNEPMFISKIIRSEKYFTGYLAGQLHGVNVKSIDK